MNEYMDGWKDRLMDGLMDGWNPPNIWIKIIQIVIQIECLHGTNFSIQIAI